MKRIFTFLLAILVVATAFPVRADELDANAKEAIAAFKEKDSGLQKFFDNSVGYAIFPNAGKGGLILGAGHGKGLVYEKGKLIGHASFTQGSIGAQIGGQSFSELVFFETQKGLNDLKKGKFEFSAQISAIAVADGVSKNSKYEHGVAVFVLPKGGLMAEATVGGQKFKYEPLPKAE